MIHRGLQAGAVALVVALLALLGWRVIVQRRDNGLAGQVAAGDVPPAPGFRLPRLDRPGSVALSSLRGKVVLLNFWASWCVPCRAEAPLLARTARRWRSRGVVVLGVDAQDFRSDARSFLRRYGVGYPNVHDAGGAVMTRYGVTGFPETWFVSRGGRLVVAHVDGPLTAARLDHDLAEALRR